MKVCWEKNFKGSRVTNRRGKQRDRSTEAEFFTSWENIKIMSHRRPRTNTIFYDFPQLRPIKNFTPGDQFPSLAPVPPLPERTERSNVRKVRFASLGVQTHLRNEFDLDLSKNIYKSGARFSKCISKTRIVHDVNDVVINTSTLTVRVGPTCLIENCLSPSPARR